MSFTQFQVTFQQTNAHLFVIFNAWTSQMFMELSLQVGHSTKSNIRSQLFNLAKHLMLQDEVGTKHTFEWVIGLHSSNTASGLVLFQHGVRLARAVSFGPTNYKQCLLLGECHICISKSPQETRFYASRIHEFKNKNCLFERLFKVKKNSVFLLEISFFVFVLVF